VILAEKPQQPGLLLIDHDKKLVREFDAVLKAVWVEVKHMVRWAPNLNAYAERWVQSIQQDCLDHFLVFGRRLPTPSLK
jgi:putative transposase